MPHWQKCRQRPAATSAVEFALAQDQDRGEAKGLRGAGERRKEGRKEVGRKEGRKSNKRRALDVHTRTQTDTHLKMLGSGSCNGWQAGQFAHCRRDACKVQIIAFDARNGVNTHAVHLPLH